MPSVHSVVAPVAEQVLRVELPGLPADRRGAVVAFSCDRVRTLPDLTRTGVLAVASLTRLLSCLPGGSRIVTALAARQVPGIGEYVRLLRSLASAYIWETWPDTAPDGSPTFVEASAP